MDLEWLRRFCLALPHTTEQVQWEDALVFKVGGRMYAVASLEPADVWLSFKCDDEEFTELVERPGVVPAPYLARAHWVGLDSAEALTRAEIEGLLRRAHELIFSALPRKRQTSLASRRANAGPHPAARRTPRRKSRSR